MKFIEFNDADESKVLININQIVAVIPYTYTRNGKEFEGTKIYCTDADTYPFRFAMTYEEVRELIRKGLEE